MKVYLSVLLGLVLVFNNDVAYAQANAPGSGYSLEYDGTSNYCETYIPPTINLPVTVEYWVKMDSNAIVRNNPIFCYECDTADFTHPYYAFWTTINANGFPTFGYGDGNGAQAVNRRSAVSDISLIFRSWNHIAWVCIGPANMKLYINGIPIPITYSGTGGPMVHHPANKTSTIGRTGKWSFYNINDWDFAEVHLDEMRIWSDVRTQQEIRENMSKKLIGNEPNLEAYWRFDEGAGATSNDSGPNAYHLNVY